MDGANKLKGARNQRQYALRSEHSWSSNHRLHRARRCSWDEVSLRAVGKTRFSFCDKPGLSRKRGAQESKKPGFYHFSDKLLVVQQKEPGG
jgi:hypothetical protein